MMSRLSISLLLSAAIGCSMLLASCGSSRSSGTTVYKTTPAGHGSQTKPDQKTFEIPQSLTPQSNALLSEARQWIGTPYRYGGEDRRGVDCSGLVLCVYRSALNLKLPRNSAEQARFCTPLAKDALIPGDLLFFDTAGGGGRKVSHVGIYVGNGMMIHSSSSKGVIVSDINSDYYKRTFAGAGYVEQYRNLIASSSTTPAQTPQQQTADADTPFNFTPVQSLPARKTPVRATAPHPTSGSTANTDPTPDEARKKVLNSLIEQKLDSIFNR